MSSNRRHKNMPYCYGYDAKTNTEILFGRDYQPLARRSFLEAREVEQIGAYTSRGTPEERYCKLGPYLEHDFAGWFYDDGNAPRFDRATRDRVSEVWKLFLSGTDVRDHLYNVHRTYQFADLIITPRKQGLRAADG
ncbi:hypothetical protein [Aliiruegeria sabulilitoris]|uniref:hypothetical protein n=1 Tax=Aliiruegeria sabulilitoris TaxID=1510458 RepID=UPI000831B0E3|nr:hypothetical protein [Aliiruegeria sabulilitoris]NDR55382.1 hypothetical protein [Pseudoruegeria sp. M32A2M]